MGCLVQLGTAWMALGAAPSCNMLRYRRPGRCPGAPELQGSPPNHLPTTPPRLRTAGFTSVDLGSRSDGNVTLSGTSHDCSVSWSENFASDLAPWHNHRRLFSKTKGVEGCKTKSNDWMYSLVSLLLNDERYSF